MELDDIIEGFCTVQGEVVGYKDGSKTTGIPARVHLGLLKKTGDEYILYDLFDQQALDFLSGIHGYGKQLELTYEYWKRQIPTESNGSFEFDKIPLIKHFEYAFIANTSYGTFASTEQEEYLPESEHTTYRETIAGKKTRPEETVNNVLIPVDHNDWRFPEADDEGRESPDDIWGESGYPGGIVDE